MNCTCMSRSVSWRRICTKDVAARIEESLRFTLFLLNEVGPTGFVVKQDGCDRKFKVRITALLYGSYCPCM